MLASLNRGVDVLWTQRFCILPKILVGKLKFKSTNLPFITKVTISLSKVFSSTLRPSKVVQSFNPPPFIQSCVLCQNPKWLKYERRDGECSVSRELLLPTPTPTPTLPQNPLFFVFSRKKTVETKIFNKVLFHSYFRFPQFESLLKGKRNTVIKMPIVSKVSFSFS